MNRYSWHTTTEKDSGGWYKCTAIVVFPGNTVKFNTYPFYMPNLKGGHRHNHIFNACHRIVFRSKSARRHVSREEKKRFVATFWANMRLNPDELGKILTKRKR